MQTLMQSASFNRVQVALLLRELNELWPVCLDVALVKELVTCGDSATEADRGGQATLKALYSAFTTSITEMRRSECLARIQATLM